MLITGKEFDFILSRKPGTEFDLTLDFGLTKVKVLRSAAEAIVEKKFKLDLSRKLKPGRCYLLKEEGLVPVAFFDEEKQRYYKLIPTRDWPSFTLGSVPMHSITRISPKEDTMRKINVLKPYGIVLDTCMGLGYTAICAAEQSRKVFTFERDENVLLLAQLNPFSRKLFSSPRIERHQEDIYQAIPAMEAEKFDCIVHDPPTFKIAPELFSREFYLHCLKVLKPGGRFYHYLPRYKVRRGYDFPARIKDKCRQAGFTVLSFLPEQGDLVCTR